MAFLLEDPDKPVIWRGPIKLGAIQQFIGDAAWGKLMHWSSTSPRTSDEPLTVAQSLPNIDGMVIVTTLKMSHYSTVVNQSISQKL